MGIADYSTLETLKAAALGWGTVFAALITLILLMWVLMAISGVLDKRAAASEAGEAPEPPQSPAQAKMIPAKGSQGEVALYGVDDKTAAMVMAVVAEKLETPLNELRFRSIREQESQKGEGKK